MQANERHLPGWTMQCNAMQYEFIVSGYLDFNVTIEMQTAEQYFPVVPYIML